MKFVCHFIPIVLWGTLIILSSITQICSSCVLEERQALLDFKASINETEHTDLILPSWIDDDEYPAAGSDCCSWEGVKCSDAAPGRIVELQLGHLARHFPGYDIYKFDRRIWHANLSILVSLENLQSLDLSDNHFGSSIFEPRERLAAFKTLQSLNLDGNRMEDNRTLECLSAISSLKNLSMVANGITSLEEPCERLAAFKSLQSLNLDLNMMEDRTVECLSTISSLKSLSLASNDIYCFEGCERLANLKNLESLNLDWNGIDNTSLQFITTISSLKKLSMANNVMEGLFPSKEINRLKQLRHLDLSSNLFSGPLSFKEICSLKNLVELDLSQNSLSGNVPLCLSNLMSLKLLDISNNDFSGNIPSLVLTSLVHLEYLSLAGNHFEGSFSFGSLANHSKLQVFTLGDQDREIYVNFDGLPLPPPFQLRVLYLVQCNLNNETRRIPDFLLSQKELRILDLSSNNLVGMFPNWVLENNTHLQFFKLRNNSFRGPFLRDDGILVPQDLLQLDISNNEVCGQVPQDIGLFFPSLDVFNLSRNCFQGSIPESLGCLKNITIIDLSHNNFSGKVPDQIGTGCVQLEELILSNNSLLGHFPSGSMNLTHLTALYLDRNHFVGSISHGLSRSSALQFFDISENEFQGKIPSWIGNFSSLWVLDLSRNILEGTIPDDICKLESLQFLDLSWNGLNGSILSCSTLSSLAFVHLEWNQFTGSIPNALVNSSKNLTTLDFRHNHLSGGIPHDIKTLSELEVLLMGENDLQGSIPVFICQIKNLNILDLSQNSFSGRIPTCLNGISFGSGNFTSPEFTKWEKRYYDIYSGDGFLFSSPRGIFYWKEEVQFRTKSITSTYTGNILNYMSGIDLSGNQLTGEIPSELGDLSHLRALNLSHNYLQGSIPSGLSMLNFIESLDLSYNNLGGQIPYELSNLHSLSFFNVSYNNLSGRTPDQGQFANFDENNYKGNPGLCGPLLQQHCGGITGKSDLMQDDGNEYQNDGGIDTVAFFWGFFVSLGAALATLVLSLYISPQYRRVWFGLIDVWILFRFYRWYRSHSK